MVYSHVTLEDIPGAPEPVLTVHGEKRDSAQQMSYALLSRVVTGSFDVASYFDGRVNRLVLDTLVNCTLQL